MDGCSSAASRDDDAANNPGVSDEAPGEDLHLPTEDSADVSVACKDCGLKFTNLDDFKTHLHQHALEEEEAVTRGDRTAAAALDAGGSGDEDKCTVSSLMAAKPEIMQSFSPDSMKNPLRNVYACTICGKTYMYRVSFEKHKKQHESPPLKENSQRQIELNLRRYECPDCGMTFIRKTRLIGHLRAHRARGQFKPKCDQCNKGFASIKSWLAHSEMHNLKRFWCLSCARGYADEVSLDKHLQHHSLSRQETTKIEEGSLADAHNRCHYCGKTYVHYRQLISHRKMHFKKHLASSCDLPGSAVFHTKEEDPEEDSVLISEKGNTKEELQREDDTQTSRGQSALPDPGGKDLENSDDSDCGEPLHCIKSSRASSQADPPSETTPEAADSQMGRDLHREHKYWEWECTECDMGFDEMAKLHLHYIQHATGEVPMPLDNTDG